MKTYKYLLSILSIISLHIVLLLNVNAAPCEFPVFHIFPKILFYENNDMLYLVPDESKIYDRLFKSETTYEFSEAKGLVATDKKQKRINKNQQSNYLKIGDSLHFGNTKYILLEFGLQRLDGKQTKIFKIPPVAREKIEEWLDGYPFEYSKDNSITSKTIESTISTAILINNKLFVGFAGGFPEGVGQPGGIAIFDFNENRWAVHWSKELTRKYITDIITDKNKLLLATRENQEFSTYPGGIFEYDLEENTIKKLAFPDSDIDAWSLKKWGIFIFFVGPEGLLIYDTITKQLKKYIWDLDISKDGKTIISKLSECYENQCMNKNRDQKIFVFYIARLFEIKNIRGFIKWAYPKLINPLPRSDNLLFLIEPYTSCMYHIEVQPEFIKFLDIEHLSLSSVANKSPLVWDVLTSVIKLNKKESQFSEIIIKASKDKNDWVRSLAIKAAKDLNINKEK